MNSRVVEHAQLQPHLQDDDLGEPAGVHQHAERRGLAVRHLREPGGGQRAEELAADRRDQDQQQLDHAASARRRARPPGARRSRRTPAAGAGR